MITKLSDEQEVNLSNYIEKWKAIATLTKPINQEKVEAAIQNAYKISNYSEAEIVFFGSPFGAIKKILATQDFKTYLGSDIHLGLYVRLLHI